MSLTPDRLPYVAPFPEAQPPPEYGFPAVRTNRCGTFFSVVTGTVLCVLALAFLALLSGGYISVSAAASAAATDQKPHFVASPPPGTPPSFGSAHPH